MWLKMLVEMQTERLVKVLPIGGKPEALLIITSPSLSIMLLEKLRVSLFSAMLAIPSPPSNYTG